MTRWHSVVRFVTRWLVVAFLCTLALAAFTFEVWHAERAGGACHGSESTYLCKLISPENLPRDYLVLIGIGGVFVALFTLKSIHHQAVQVRKQTEILKKSADAAKDAADAAKRNIALFVSKEGARLTIEFLPLSLEPLEDTTDGQRVTYVVSLKFSHFGTTEGYIVDSGQASGFLPVEHVDDPGIWDGIILPILSLPPVLSPGSKSVHGYSFWDMSPEAEKTVLPDIKKGNPVVVIRGFVVYRDIFDRVRKIRFRRYWKAEPIFQTGEWVKCGPPEDNQET